MTKYNMPDSNSYADAVDDWIINQDEHSIRERVRRGEITKSEYKKITGEDY